MSTYKGILSFPALFTPKLAKGATDPKFSGSILLPPGDPQIAVIQAEVEAAKGNSFPSGYTGSDECFAAYDTKYAGKDYYDARFTGWYVLSFSAKQDDKPAVVDMAHQPIINPGDVISGMVVWVSMGISGYTKGKGGIGGWLNGVMVTAEEPPMGRLDNKPSVDQMFANVGAPPAAGTYPDQTLTSPVTAPAPAPAPVAPTPPPAAPPAPAPALQMTAAANGVTYETYMATPGWTDELLIAQGLAIKPSFA